MVDTSMLLQHIEEGTLIRHKWTGYDTQGRKTACLLAALVTQTGYDQSTDACPTEVMPSWLAQITPWMDDDGTAEAWPAMVRRYADLASRWHVLTPETWQKLEYTLRILCLDEVSRNYDTKKWPIVTDAITVIRTLCVRGVNGAIPLADEYKTADHLAVQAFNATFASAIPGLESVALTAMWAACNTDLSKISKQIVDTHCTDMMVRATVRTAPIGPRLNIANPRRTMVDRITSAILDSIEQEIITCISK